MPGCLRLGSPLTTSSADPVREITALPGRNAAPHCWKICSMSRQRGSRLASASPLPPHLPSLLGRGGGHLNPSLGVKVGCPMPGHLCLLALFWAKLSPMGSRFVGTAQGDVGCSDLEAVRLPGTRHLTGSNKRDLGSGFVLWQKAEVSSCWPSFI